MKLPETREEAEKLFEYPSIESGLMSSEVKQCADILIQCLAELEDQINCNDPRRKSYYWDLLTQ